MKIFKLLYLVLILFPVAIIYGLVIAIITFIDYVIDKSKMK